MSNIEKQIDQQVDQFANFVYRHKNQGMKAIFKAEKVGQKLGKDIGDILIKGIYGTISQTELRNRLYKAIASKNAIEIEPLDRLKTSPEQKTDAVKEFLKNVIEGLGPRMPSTSGVTELALHIAYTIKAIKERNKIEYLRNVELYGYEDKNPYYNQVSPEDREKVKNGLIK